jgi:hypothetical protein
VHHNSRFVKLVSSLSDDGKTLTVTGPPNERIYPPGYGWVYLLVGGVPSAGKRVMIGDGSDPPFDQEAMENVLRLA